MPAGRRGVTRASGSRVRGGNKMHIQKKIRVALWAASTVVGIGLGVGELGPTLPTPVQAQAIPKSLEQGGPDAELRARKNQWTLGVAGGLLSGSNMTFADELAQVLDDGDNLRILPIVTYGVRRSISDRQAARPA